MSKFGEELKQYMKESGFSVIRLSKLTQVNYSMLLKTTNGKRLITEEQLFRVMEYLRMNRLEKQELFRYYQMDKYGKERYLMWEKVHIMVRDIVRIRDMDISKEQCPFMPYHTWKHAENTGIGQLTGKSEVSSYLHHMLERELSEREPDIVMDYFPECESLLNALSHHECRADQKISCMQYVKLYQSELHKYHSTNFDVLHVILPYAYFMRNQYTVKYRNFEGNNTSDYLSLWPHFMLSSSELILFSEGMESGMILREKEILASYRTRIAEFDSRYKPLFEISTASDETLSAFFQKEDMEYPIASLQGSISPIWMFTEEMLHQRDSSQIAKQFYHKVVSMAQVVKEQKRKRAAIFFGFYGLKTFFKTGQLPDIYGSYIGKCTLQERKLMLRRLEQTLRDDQSEDRFLLSAEYPDMKDIHIELYEPDTVMIDFTGTQNFGIISIRERGMYDAFKDYLEHLKNSKYIYRSNEMLKQYTALLDEMTDGKGS